APRGDRAAHRRATGESPGRSPHHKPRSDHGRSQDRAAGEPVRSRRGFTLLEVLVATTIMGIAVVTLLSALSTSVRNATWLTDYDRAVLLARAKMDSLLVDPALPRQTVMEQPLDPVLLGGAK